MHGNRTTAWRRQALVACLATAPLLAEHGEAGKDKEAVLSVMKGRPSLRVGDWLKVDFRTKIQADFRGFRPEIKTAEGWFDPRRLRLGIQGRATSDLEFQIEFDLLPRHHQLRDAFVNYRRFPRYQLQAGKFKIPFGLDQLTEPTDLDFVYRSRIGEMLAPGRDTGIMVHGVLFEQELRYSAGLFRHDGENAEIILSGARTLAARLTGSPAAFLPAPAFFKGLELGAAFTHTLVPEGLTSLRGRSVAGETFFPRMYVRGTRWRQGLELNWQLGSLSLKGEYMGTREERLRQSLLRTDLPPLRTGGWYVSATHPLFGQRKDRTSGSFLRSLIRTN